MAKFILAGSLGETEYGNVFEMRARNITEAIRSLMFQVEGFRNKLKSVNIRIRINGRSCTGNDNADIVRAFQYPLGENDTVVIAPARAGAGGNVLGGIFMIVAGIVAIVLAIPSGGASLAAWSAGAMAMAAAGALMVFGGAAMLFTKIPKAGKFNTSSANEKNTSFSSIDNMAAQGAPIPIVMGRMLVGSRVIQQSIETMPRN